VTLVDAGPLIALFHPSDVDHARCHETLDGLSGPLVTTWVTLGEAMHVLGRWRGWRAQEALWRVVVDGDIDVQSVAPGNIGRVAELMRKYRSLPMDLGDATIVTLAEELGVNRVFTLDRHFRTYRLHGRRAFEVVPG
jgi:predicted nucleic acid-binding protein